MTLFPCFSITPSLQLVGRVGKFVRVTDNEPGYIMSGLTNSCCCVAAQGSQGITGSDNF